MKTLRLRAAFCAIAMAHAASFTAQAEDVAPRIPSSKPGSLSSSRLAEAAQMTPVTQNTCISFSYDQNGNRMTQTTSNTTATAPTWGSSIYPCFVWTAN
jgi:hypothetical protein